MKYLVYQQRNPGKHFVTVATCQSGEDALLFAAVLCREKPQRGCVQVWARSKCRHAFALFCKTVDTTTDLWVDDLSKALADWKGKEKQWKAQQRLEKQAHAVRVEFIQQYSKEDMLRLREDIAFAKGYYSDDPNEVRAARARAMELGIHPREAAIVF